MKKIIYLVFLLSMLVNIKILAQTYCYKFLYSIKDEIKISGPISKNRNLFYFTFTDDKSRCFFTDKNGVYTGGYGQDTYKYVGQKNGINIYKECNQNMFRNGQSMLYFSSDFRRLNWRCATDDYLPEYRDCIRVLEYVADPNTVDVPSQLY